MKRKVPEVFGNAGAPDHPSEPEPSITAALSKASDAEFYREYNRRRLRMGSCPSPSDLSYDAGEHKRRCQAVADIGGWAKLCEMGEHNRGIIRAQFVAAYDRAGVVA